MQTYRVVVTETITRTCTVMCGSADEAESMAKEAYVNGDEAMFSDDEYSTVNASVIE